MIKMEKCYNQCPHSFATCRLNKGHKGNHKWWTSIGNSPSKQWEQS